MPKRYLYAAAAIACLTSPALAESHSHPARPDAPGRYSSFVMKIPYSFDLPPEIVGVLLRCGIGAENARNSVTWDVIIRLANGNSGEVLTGFDDLKTYEIEEFNQMSPNVEKHVRDLMTPELFSIKTDCRISEFATRSTSYVAAYKDNVGRYGLFQDRITANQTSAKAWLTDDFAPQGVKRHFNQSENEAFGEFEAGLLVNPDDNLATTVAPSRFEPGGLNSLGNILTRP